MSRTGKDNRPPLKPVEKIELSERSKKIRLILVFAFIAVALIAFTFAIVSYLSSGTGWTTIKVSSNDFSTNCSGDFVFQYYLGDSGISATAENKAVIALYTEAATHAFEVFDTAAHTGVNNIAYINENPNQSIEVDPLLYDALTLINEYSERTVFISPIYDYYYNLFTWDYDYQAQDFDPFTNAEAAEFIAQVLVFVNNPDDISVTLLGDNRIILNVSDEYLAFANLYQITDLIDFGWIKNAFIIDYFADIMIESGYTKGNFSSYDGFVRNLDERDIEYSLNLYDLNGSSPYLAGIMKYTSDVSLVYYRSFPLLDSLDYFRYYQYEDGTIRTSYIDVTDGLCKTALNGLVCYSKTAGCAEILLRSMPVYIDETLDEAALDALSDAGIEYIRPDKYSAG